MNKSEVYKQMMLYDIEAHCEGKERVVFDDWSVDVDSSNYIIPLYGPWYDRLEWVESKQHGRELQIVICEQTKSDEFVKLRDCDIAFLAEVILCLNI